MKPAPPVTRSLVWRRSRVSAIAFRSGPATPDSDVFHSGGLDFRRLVDVAQIAQHGVAHDPAQTGQVQASELVPFGDDRQRVGAPRRLIDVLGELDALEDWPGL